MLHFLEQALRMWQGQPTGCNHYWHQTTSIGHDRCPSCGGTRRTDDTPSDECHWPDLEWPDRRHPRDGGGGTAPREAHSQAEPHGGDPCDASATDTSTDMAQPSEGCEAADTGDGPDGDDTDGGLLDGLLDGLSDD